MPTLRDEYKAGMATSQTPRQIGAGANSIVLQKTQGSGGATGRTEQTPKVTSEKSPLSFWQRLKFSFGDRGGKKKALEQMGYKVYDSADGNFILNKGGQTTRFDEKGWSLKDLADLAGEALPIGSAIGGGAAGSLAAPVTGGASIYAGGAAGAGLGEVAREAIGRGLGVREEGFSARDIGFQTIGGGLGMAGAGKGAQIIGKTLGPKIAAKLGIRQAVGGGFETVGRSLLAPILGRAPLSAATRGIGGRAASEAVEGAIGGALQSGGVTALQGGDIGQIARATGEGGLIGTGLGAVLGPFIPGRPFTATARRVPPTEVPETQVRETAPQPEIDIKTPEGQRVLLDAAAKRQADPGAVLNPPEESALRQLAERRATSRVRESEDISSTARRLAVMQETMAPGREGTIKEVNDTLERVLASKNPTPEEDLLIKRINRLENNIKKAIVKAGGADKYLGSEIEAATDLEAAKTRRDMLNDYNFYIGKTTETGTIPQQPAPAQPAPPQPAPATPEIRLASARVEGPTMGRDVSITKPLSEEIAKQEGVVSQETLRTRTSNMDLIINENEMLKGFYSDLGALSLDPRYANNSDAIMKELIPLYPELTPKEIGTMVQGYMKFKPTSLAEKSRMDDAIEAQLEGRVREAEAISGTGEDIIPAATPEVPGEKIAGGAYEKALTRDIEKDAKKILLHPPQDTEFPWRWTWERNDAYSKYFEAKARGDILPNKTIEERFSKIQKILSDISDDTLSLEVDGKKLSFEDYILAKLAEDKNEAGDVVRRIGVDIWRGTRFGDLIRGLENWPKFRGFKLKTTDPGVVTDSAGNDITKAFQKQVLDSRTGRIESLGAPYPKDLRPYIYAVIEKHKIPNPEIPDSTGRRTDFIEWQNKTRPKLAKEGKTSTEITDKLELIPEIRYTPEQAELLKIAKEKVGEDVGLALERGPVDFARPAPEGPSRPRTTSELIQEKMATRQDIAEERARRGKTTGRGPLSANEAERAMFRRKWAKVFGEGAKTPFAPIREPSANPDDFRARIDPENELSNEQILTRYAQDEPFTGPNHFWNKINKWADGGDKTAAEIRDSLSEEQIKEIYTSAKEIPTEGTLIAAGEKPTARTLLATPETTAGMRLEFPGAPEGFGIRGPVDGPVSPEGARAGLERFAAEQRPTARLAAAEAPELPKNIQAEIDAIPDDILPLDSITLSGDFGGGGRKIRVGNPLKMGALMQIGNEFRTAMATGDLSLLLRQLIMVGPRFPDIYAAAFPKSFKFMFSKKAYDNFVKIMESDPAYIRAKAENPTFFSQMDGPINAREEQYMAKYIHKVPILGNIIKASERAFQGTANSVRLDIYKRLLKQAGLGADAATPEGLKIRKEIAGLVGAMTGRGILDPQGLVNRNRALVNSFMFSPGLMKARLYFLDPRTYLDPSKDKFVRKEAFKAALAFGTTMTSLLGLAAASGIKVGSDPNSSDFGKMRFGKTRIDLLGGYQQYIVALSRLATGDYTTSKGKRIDLTAGGPLSRYDILLRFLENKEAPLFSFMTTMLKGTSFDGKPVEVQKEILQRLTPIVAQDIYDIAKENPELLPAGVLSFLGAGVQTYK